jgi:hypothetical protein
MLEGPTKTETKRDGNNHDGNDDRRPTTKRTEHAGQGRAPAR